MTYTPQDIILSKSVMEVSSGGLPPGSRHVEIIQEVWNNEIKLYTNGSLGAINSLMVVPGTFTIRGIYGLLLVGPSLI